MSIGDEVLELFDRHGWRAYSEQVCMAEHSTQAAALAPEACSSDALVLSNLLGRRDLGHRMTMRPGECLVLDNQRVLHRWEGESDPARRLQGRYLARDWVKGQVFACDARWNGWNRGTQELCYTYLMLLTVCKSHRQNRKS